MLSLLLYTLAKSAAGLPEAAAATTRLRCTFTPDAKGGDAPWVILRGSAGIEGAPPAESA